MRRNLLLSCLAIPALALVLWARPADACGPYGAPTPRQQVVSLAWNEMHDNFVDRDVHFDTIDVDAEHGVARLDVNYERGGKRMAAVLVFVQVDGGWKLAGRLDRAHSPSGAVPSKVRKTL